MTTLAAQITEAGISAPDYPDILQQLKIAFWSIYGADANLDDDTQDGQLLAVYAQAIHDSNQLAISVFNSFIPGSAQGAGLSRIVKINGLSRLVPSNSTVTLAIVGQGGTQINDGRVGDDLNLGTTWALPSVVNIPGGGSVNVTATCEQVGAVEAAAGSLTSILTPTRGWQSSNNVAVALTGNPTETDAALRQRQSVSTAGPALTVLEAIYAAIAEIDSVQRLTILENDTGVPDGNGIPGHTIAAVVEGGSPEEVAGAIFSKKTPGTGTFGSTTVVVSDNRGLPHTINYDILDEVSLNVEVTVSVLAGWSATTIINIQQAVADFVNALGIGDDSYRQHLATAASLGSVGLGATFVVTGVEQARAPAVPSDQDIVIAFNEAATCAVEDIDVVLA